jgi:transposase
MHALIPMPASGSLTAIDAKAVLEPGRGRTKTGRFWRYAVDDRPWTEFSHPGATYVYSEDRRGEHAIRGDASK